MAFKTRNQTSIGLVKLVKNGSSGQMLTFVQDDQVLDSVLDLAIVRYDGGQMLKSWEKKWLKLVQTMPGWNRDLQLE